MDNNINIGWLLAYTGIGLIISAVVLWRNEFKHAENAHPFSFVWLAVFLTVSWGLWAALIVMVPIVDFLDARWPMKNYREWWDKQYER